MAGHVAHLQREFANKGIDRQVVVDDVVGGSFRAFVRPNCPLRPD